MTTLDTDPSAMLARVRLFVGAATDVEAHVYAQLEHGSLPEGCTLSGSLYGPSCPYARTLPARIALKDAGPGKTLLARCIVPDPCFWSPALPYLYQATVTLRCGERELATIERPVGLQRFCVSGTNLRLDGRRSVIRGVCREVFDDCPHEQWREASAAMVVDDPEESLCEQCSRDGVLLVAVISTLKPEAIARELARLGSWPAVGVTVLGGNVQIDGEIALLAGNMLLAQRLKGLGPIQLAPWAKLAFCDVDTQNRLPSGVEHNVPVLAFRAAGGMATVADARAACDQLQRDLAPVGDFAGYLV
jgi:hypothetical protein